MKIHDLQNSLFFLHGVACSGKSVIYKVFYEQFSKENYAIYYISSGELFREAFANPHIADQVRKGYYLDTLEAILFGLEKIYKEFLYHWVESHGKTILILDGVIRRKGFINEKRREIPSQIEQIAKAFNHANQQLVLENKKFINNILSDYKNPIPDSIQIQKIEKMIKNSIHILIDVSPNDVELHMLKRADKEIADLRAKLESRVSEKIITKIKAASILKDIKSIEGFIHQQLDTDNQLVIQEITRVRKHIAKTLAINESASLISSFESIGISTGLRDDDLSSLSRKNRIANYVRYEKDNEGKQVCKLGFAGQVLIDDLDFTFLPDGSFQSAERNKIVIKNGIQRGIGLKKFQTTCENIAKNLYNKTEIARIKLFQANLA